ncbi:unnamed protein product [Tetraodon nigroviridis]|uniref:(spotted green pufferfish) hypothetical protein n=1 Tax=Tetraodon nigroviridis TaxID=99883 RepID=Q4S6D3_TETNG|nr:unnamed protein product [Tetraodon nigroviridis]
MENMTLREVSATSQPHSGCFQVCGASFIGEVNRQEPRMSQTAQNVNRIVSDIQNSMKQVVKYRRFGNTLGAFLGGLRQIAVPFTGGLGLPVVAAANRLVTAKTPSVVRFLEKNQKGNELERLGKEFLRIAQPLNGELKEIKATARDLQQEMPGNNPRDTTSTSWKTSFNW